MELRRVGQSNRTIVYRCDDCGHEFTRELLRSKRAQFSMMGKGGKVFRSRVVKWLCVPCMEADPDYQRERFTEAPGLQDVRDATTS